MTFFSRAKKTIKRGARAATKATGKRYGVSYGRQGLKMSKSSVSRIAKDVMMIKSRLNVEKKFKQGSISTGTIAQMNVNAPGYFTSTLTPLISKGTGESDRVGGSLKLTGLHIQLQIAAQNDSYGARKFKCHIIKSTDSSVTNAVNDLFDTNPLTNVVDYHSNRNYTNNPKAHQIIRTQYMYLPQRGNAVSGQFAKQIINKNVGIKMQQITRFEGDDNFPKDCYYYLLILCDTGNSGGSVSSNSGCMNTSANSGVDVQEIFKWWYVDN